MSFLSKFSSFTCGIIPTGTSLFVAARLYCAASNRRNYFELFSIPQKFEVDIDRLEKSFKDLQRRFHPDKFHTAHEEVRTQKESESADINVAYKTLRDPRLRAQYMIALAGAHQEEERTVSDNPSILMEIMEIRESIEEAKSQDELSELKNANDKRIKAWTQIISKALESKDFPSAQSALDHLQYYSKIDEEIKTKLDPE